MDNSTFYIGVMCLYGRLNRLPRAKDGIFRSGAG